MGGVSQSQHSHSNSIKHMHVKIITTPTIKNISAPITLIIEGICLNSFINYLICLKSYSLNKTNFQTKYF